MALKQQISRLTESFRANKELVSVLGAAGLALIGLGAPYCVIRANNRVLAISLQKEVETREREVEKERELSRKGEEELKAMMQSRVEAAKAEAAEKMMARILQLCFHRDYKKHRRELTREEE